jgi:hypothetical protein
LRFGQLNCVVRCSEDPVVSVPLQQKRGSSPSPFFVGRTSFASIEH